MVNKISQSLTVFSFEQLKSRPEFNYPPPSPPQNLLIVLPLYEGPIDSVASTKIINPPPPAKIPTRNLKVTKT